MPRALILVFIRLFVLLATAVSSALLYDYRGAAPAFCATGEGCAKIKESAWASIAGVPTPVIGLLAFIVLYSLTLLPHPRRKQLMVPTAVLGALGGIGFLLIQAFVEHTFCKLCVVVDTSAILAAGAAVAYWFKGDEGHDGALSQGGWGAIGAVAVVAPLLFGRMQPDPEVKASVSRHWVPGKVNIVELSDFECPFCRIQHASLQSAMEPYSDKINFVRLTVPLGGHPNARPASKAYVCARDLGKGEIMAHALFTTELSKESIEQIVADFAQQQGVDPSQLKACIADPKTDARVGEEYSRARDQIGFKGLPTTWVGKKLFEGAAGPDSLRKAIEHELEGKGTLRPTASPVWLWSGLVGLLLVFGALALRRTRN